MNEYKPVNISLTKPEVRRIITALRNRQLEEENRWRITGTPSYQDEMERLRELRLKIQKQSGVR